jgi:hypothetical protein
MNVLYLLLGICVLAYGLYSNRSCTTFFDGLMMCVIGIVLWFIIPALYSI